MVSWFLLSTFFVHGYLKNQPNPGKEYYYYIAIDLIITDGSRTATDRYAWYAISISNAVLVDIGLFDTFYELMNSSQTLLLF